MLTYELQTFSTIGTIVTMSTPLEPPPMPYRLIRRKLVGLYRRKIALDRLIASLEDYHTHCSAERRVRRRRPRSVAIAS